MDGNQKLQLEIVKNRLKYILENNKENDVIKISKSVVENIVEKLEIVAPTVYCKNCMYKGKSSAFPDMIYCKLYSVYKFPDEYCCSGEKKKNDEKDETD